MNKTSFSSEFQEWMKAEESTGKKRKPRVPSLQQRIKSKERQKRYRARSSVISVSREIVQELQAIGQENGISSNGDVIALLISTYRQVSASTPGGARQQNEAHSERCQLNLASDWGDRTVAIFHPVELADIPTDGQERRQEKHKRWKPTRSKAKRARVTPQNDLADTLTHPGNKNRKRDASTLIRKRITLAIRFESGPDVTVRGASICEVRPVSDEERSGCKKMEIEKQEQKKQKEEEEEKEEEWLESEPEEQYDSKDLEYLSSPAAEKDTNEGEEPIKRKKALRSQGWLKSYLMKCMNLPKCFRCTICQALLSSVQKFDKHMGRNHEAEGKVFRSELLQLLEKKKTPEVLERYKEELRKRGLNPEVELKRQKCLEKPKDLHIVGQCQHSPIAIERSTRMQARASKRRTEQEGAMMKRMDDGEGDCGHLSGEGQPDHIHRVEVGDALASMLRGDKTVSSESIDEHCGAISEAVLWSIEEEIEANDRERKQGYPERKLIDQEDDEERKDIRMHDKEEGLGTGNGSKNVANVESQVKDEPKSFYLDQDIDIICWMDGWSDIFCECGICKIYFPVTLMCAHAKTHGTGVHCEYCNHRFSTFEKFRNHLANCEAKGMDELKPRYCLCEICGKSYKDVARHVRVSHGQLQSEFPMKAL